MAHLVIDHRDPHPLLVVYAAVLPVLRVDQMDAAILEGFARGLAPVEVFEPFDRRAFDVVVAAEVGNGAPKRTGAMQAEKEHEIAVNLPTIDDWRNDHSHGTRTSRWRPRS